MGLTNKVVVITGSRRGLGFEIAQHFRKQGAIIVGANRPHCDITRPGDPERLIERAVHDHYRIDILINSAAIFGPVGEFRQTSLTDWSHVMMTNIMGTVRFCRAALPYAHHIVNVVGGSNICPSLMAYNVSKAAVVRFTEELAEAYPDKRINALAPGPLQTGFVDHVRKAGREELAEQASEDFTKAVRMAAFLAECDFSGKLLSARYDDATELLQSPDAYKIRRIDAHTLSRNVQPEWA